MKIVLVQGRVRGDRPGDNLENIKNTLKRKEVEGAALVVFPALVLSGRLGPVAKARPGLEIQYDKVLADFLSLSAGSPDTALATTHFDFSDVQSGREEVLVALGGRLVYRQSLQSDAKPLEFKLKDRNLAFWPGQAEAPPAPAEAEIYISFRNQQFEGQPYFPPEGKAGGSWRINVSAVGGEGPYIYDGATWVFDPEGQLKGWADGFSGAMVILDTRSGSLPTLKPLPIRHPMAVLHQALTAGLRDFVLSAGSGQVVIGLSGGLDSAVTALLAVDALGAQNVLGVAMPSEYNSPDSLTLARDLADKLNISFLTVPIDAVKEAFTRSFLLTPKRSEKDGHLADENIQARIRAVLLMYLANREDRLLLATGNKSEAAMGYATLYGDTCGAIAPIGDVYKSRLFDLARYLNREGERIPEGIISRAPSAELRPDQKDEDSLPPYEILDDILYRHLEGGQSGSQVAKMGGHSAMTVAWVLSTLKKTAFKRAQEPFSLVASTSPLAGLDWAKS